MAVNREHWKPRFPRFPSWLCPSCQSGSLALDPETLKVVETGPSLSAHSHEAWEPDWIDERFAGLLICQNGACGEIVAIGGRMDVDLDYGDGELYREFKPIFMEPAPPVFPIPEKCPKPVATQLRRAFAIFWFDLGSCGNRLRAAAEALLTDKKVPRTTITNSGRKERLSLHARIEKFKQTDAQSAEYLSAIKWIGNVGSHPNLDELGWSELLDAFELFEHVVERIYVQREKRLTKMAKSITSRKGRPVRRKSAFLWLK